MLIQITGTTGGASPYDIFLCDPTNISCFYISGVTSIPATVVIDTQNYFPNESFLYLKIIDTNGCIYSTEIDCGTVKRFQDAISFIFMDGYGYIFQ